MVVINKLSFIIGLVLTIYGTLQVLTLPVKGRELNKDVVLHRCDLAT